LLLLQLVVDKLRRLFAVLMLRQQGNACVRNSTLLDKMGLQRRRL
jgi:hypothetical protein